MKEHDRGLLSVPEEYYIKVIGKAMLDYAKGYDIHKAARGIESAAMELIEQIRRILDDDTLADPDCFYRIEALVDALADASPPPTSPMG